MARMSIDDSVARDPRITLLSKMLGWSRHAALGCLVADVWPICYDQATHLISPKLIDVAAGQVGFADAMVDCELAKRVRGGKLSVSGAAERIEYLEKKKESGRVGGIKSAELRRKISSITTSTPSYGAQAPWNPPDPVLVPDSAPVPDPAVVPDPVPVSKKRSASPAPPGAQLGIDSFHSYFVRNHGGEKPSWDPRNLKRMHDLVRVRGVETVVRRLEILESSPPKWPDPPWDLATFVQHFDKVAAPSNSTQSGLQFALGVASGATP